MKSSKASIIRTMRCPKRQCGSSSARCGYRLTLVPGKSRSRLVCHAEDCGFVLTVRNELLQAEAERKLGQV